MSGFYLINEKRFPLHVKDYNNTDLLPYYRWEHRVTIGYGPKRYMVFVDNLKNAVYIEEFDGDLAVIDDEELWQALFLWTTQKGYLMTIPPMLKPKAQEVQRFV